MEHRSADKDVAAMSVDVLFALHLDSGAPPCEERRRPLTAGLPALVKVLQRHGGADETLALKASQLVSSLSPELAGKGANCGGRRRRSAD